MGLRKSPWVEALPTVGQDIGLTTSPFFILLHSIALSHHA